MDLENGSNRNFPREAKETKREREMGGGGGGGVWIFRSCEQQRDENESGFSVV